MSTLRRLVQLSAVALLTACACPLTGELHAQPARDAEFSFVGGEGASTTRFDALVGGSVVLNRFELDAVGNVAAERRYDRDSIAPGAVVADGAIVGLTGASRGTIAVTGNLEEADHPQPGADEIVLWIDLYDTAGKALETVGVRARDLRPRGVYERYEELQSVALPFDLTRARDIPHELRIRVRFAATASVALSTLTVIGAGSD